MPSVQADKQMLKDVEGKDGFVGVETQWRSSQDPYTAWAWTCLDTILQYFASESLLMPTRSMFDYLLCPVHVKLYSYGFH